MHRIMAVVLIFLGGAALSVQAAVFDFNYSPTSTLFTADNGVRTEWLHLTETDHLTFNQVSSLLANDPAFKGYEVPTMAMVGEVTQTLFGFNWATLPQGASTVYDEYCLDAVSFFGSTYTYVTYPHYIWGYTADMADDNPNLRYTLFLTDNNFTGHRDDGYLYRYIVSTGDVNPQRGTFLVRQVSSVPVPGGVWLLGSGLAGFLGLRRKLNR